MSYGEDLNKRNVIWLWRNPGRSELSLGSKIKTSLDTQNLLGCRQRKYNIYIYFATCIKYKSEVYILGFSRETEPKTRYRVHKHIDSHYKVLAYLTIKHKESMNFKRQAEDTEKQVL